MASLDNELPEDAPYDASDPVQVNNARKTAGRKKKSSMEAVKAIMSLPQCRKWMYTVLEDCHIFQTSFVQGDPHATSFREGERNAGLRILAEVMAAAPKEYAVMLGENKHG